MFVAAAAAEEKNSDETRHERKMLMQKKRRFRIIFTEARKLAMRMLKMNRFPTRKGFSYLTVPFFMLTHTLVIFSGSNPFLFS